MDFTRPFGCDFEWDEYDLAEISSHGVESFEVEECFYNVPRQIFRNKKKGRKYRMYRLIGYTDGGRRLTIVFYEKYKNVIRVITA